MLSDEIITIIAKAFIGDIEGYYSYKSGPAIITFFNANFGFSDTYRQGFPSRWAFAKEKLGLLGSRGQLVQFLEMILSKRYVMRDLSINEVDALEKIENNLSFFNDNLKPEGYRILKNGDTITLIQDNMDLVFIGGGGFADVYRSKSTGLVVKKLRDDFKTMKSVRHRFKREFNITKDLSDIGGVVTVYDFDETDYSYTMEFGEQTLERYIREYEHSESTQINIIRQILHVMKQVHNRNKIHRDISPNNILLFSGQLKITDFGLGKDLDMFHSHRTMYTKNFGQYHYCAPEQFMQLKDGDKRSDVFSLGSLINFILTEDPRNTAHFLRNPVVKAKNENPNIRYENAGDLLAAVERAIRYHQDSETESRIYEKIKKKLFDEEVENYISCQDAKSICERLIQIPNMYLAVRSFIEKNPDQIIDFINGLDQNYCEVCRRFEDYDEFASIAYFVITNNMDFVAQEISGRILNHIARDVNRFSAQRLIDDLISKGIDPMIEDILA